MSGMPNAIPLPPEFVFGLAVTPAQDGLYFVDDGTNTLNLFR